MMQTLPQLKRPGAIAIIDDIDGNVLLQLRDGKTSHFPDRWGLFGGGIEEGEHPAEALLREMREELGWPAPRPMKLGQDKTPAGRDFHVFHLTLDRPLTSLTLLEGADMRLFKPAEAATLDMVPHHKDWLMKFQKRLI